MPKTAIEAPAPAPVADGIWRPLFIEERQAYICHRRLLQNPDAVLPEGKTIPRTLRETYGARLNGPEGVRFSPMYLFQEGDAQAQCDRLNNGD